MKATTKKKLRARASKRACPLDPRRAADDLSCREPSDFEFAAVHEASHAVLTRITGRWPYFAMVDPSGKSGCVSPSRNCSDAQSMRLDMVMLAAGGAAERRLWMGKRAGDSRDFELMQEEARLIHGTIAEWKVIDAEVRKAGVIADFLVNRYWDEILKVAREIIHLGRMMESIPVISCEERSGFWRTNFELEQEKNGGFSR